MFGRFGISWRYSLVFILLGLVLQASPALVQEQLAPAAAPPAAAEADTQQLIADIKNRQKALEAQAASVTKRLSVAAAEAAEQLKAELEIIGQIKSTYDQQAAALERLRSLEAKKQLFQEEIANLQKPSTTGKHFSFMELDRAREELNVESSRGKNLASRIKLADEAVQKTEQLVQEKQDMLTQLEDTTKEAPSSPQSEIALETARLDLELAKQIQTLRQLELRGERRAKNVRQTHLELLRRQVELLQAHAVFGYEELQEQLRHIDKEAFELNRELSRAKEQQIIVKSRLEQARKKLAAARPEEQKRAEAETEALRLQFEALRTQIDTTSRRIELLSDWKEIWQRRYAVFNQSVEQATLPIWRDEARSKLDQIDQEETTLKLWLADWQNRLITLNNKIENSEEAAPEEIQGLTRQRDSVIAIIKHFQGLQTAFENSRRLLKKLVAEIDLRTSQRSWRGWLDLVINYEIYDNTVLEWACAFASALITFTLLYFLRWLLIRKFKHLEDPAQISLANGFLSSVKRANSFFFLMLAVSVASLFLTLDPKIINNIIRLTKVAFIFQAAIWGSGFVRLWIFRTLARRTKRDSASMGALSIFNFTSQIIVWSIGLLLILQNLGINVTALVAGLGIGGIAVALSLQRILNDLFSSLSIVLDKPFVIGDFIIFDDFLGSIEHIGIKTTRIRSLTGEQIICPNGNLLDTRIRNYKRMQERRIAFKIGVVYQTPAEKLQQIPAMIREIIEAQEPTRFDRAHFASYGDFALIFEIVYYVLSPDYNVYMDIQQAINLEIFERFQASGIEFAYPTQSLYLQSVQGIESQATGSQNPG